MSELGGADQAGPGRGDLKGNPGARHRPRRVVEENRGAEKACHGSVKSRAMPEVHICEVGPRDGLQNAKHMMPTAAKKAWISALAAAGLKEIEVGSFVPPKLIPAMADTGEIVAHARTIPRLTVVALAPNLKGYQRAVEAGAHKVTFPVSASRAHSESNVRMTPDQMVAEVRKCAALGGAPIEGAISKIGRASCRERG